MPPTMIINVGQSDNSASNPGHINYTFNDGNGNTFTVGVTSVGSLPPDHPAYRPSATMGGIGFEPLALDGVLHFETPMQGVTSAPIPLDAAQFASFLTFINANLGTNHSVANLAILPVDYDLGRAGLDPFTRPANAGGNAANVTAYAAGAFETQTLFGDITTAQSYAQYLQNPAMINALIAAEPSSAFTAAWTITFARVLELGLDRRWKSDWLGGWAAFLDETADGGANDNEFIVMAAA